MYSIKIRIPAKVNLSIIKHKTFFCFFFYSDFLSYKYPTQHTSSFLYNKELNLLTVQIRQLTEYSALLSTHLNKLLFTFHAYYFAKFKWKGKGFRIYKQTELKFMGYLLGFSHFKLIKFNTVLLLKLAKFKFMVFGISQTKLHKLIKIVQKIKPMNVYTKRGLRYAHQILRKRRGKSSIL